MKFSTEVAQFHLQGPFAFGKSCSSVFAENFSSSNIKQIRSIKDKIIILRVLVSGRLFPTGAPRLGRHGHGHGRVRGEVTTALKQNLGEKCLITPALPISPH